MAAWALSKRILHVVTNRGQYAKPSHPTGLWLSELSHAWDAVAAADHAQYIVGPAGGACPLDPPGAELALAGRLGPELDGRSAPP